MNADEAYAQCEQITWEQARNFAYGIRLLPRDKRRALAAVYAFARRIDDIGDGDLPRRDEDRAARGGPAAGARAAGRGGQGRQGRPASEAWPAALTRTTRCWSRWPTPARASRSRWRRSTELIDGCLADVNQASYKTFDDLLWYCRCVAGCIGRLLARHLRRHATRRSRAKLADDLGVALQLTNILRDVREDFRNNRIYLPDEDLDRFGIEFAPFGEPEPFPTEAMQARFATLVEFEAARAREWYGCGLRLLATIDRRSAACTGAMAGIYRRLLDRIAANPHAVLEGRMSLPGSEKALVAAEALAGFDRWKYRKGAGAVRAVVVGGGLAGITAAIALAPGGARGHAARGQAPAGRRDDVVHPRRPGHRHRPARVPALLHRLPRPARPPRAWRRTPRCSPASTSPWSPRGKRRELRRRRVPAPLHMLPALLGYPFLTIPERSRLSRAALAFKRLDEADPKTDEIRLGDWLAAHGQDDGPGACCGTCSPSPR